ncbi:hypothetical protein XENOCAPTIV_015655, partial [Xenoophorus captivus]
ASMRDLRKCLLEIDGHASVARTQADLISFAQQWDRLNQSPLDDYNTRTAASSDETGEGMEDTDESAFHLQKLPDMLLHTDFTKQSAHRCISYHRFGPQVPPHTIHHPGCLIDDLFHPKDGEEPPKKLPRSTEH